IIAYIAEDGLLSIFQAIGTKMPAAVVTTALVIVLCSIVCDCAAQIKNSVVHQPEICVVSRRNLERDEAIVNPVQVYLYRHRLFRCRFLLLVVLLRIVSGLLVSLHL